MNLVVLALVGILVAVFVIGVFIWAMVEEIVKSIRRKKNQKQKSQKSAYQIRQEQLRLERQPKGGIWYNGNIGLKAEQRQEAKRREEERRVRALKIADVDRAVS